MTNTTSFHHFICQWQRQHFLLFPLSMTKTTTCNVNDKDNKFYYFICQWQGNNLSCQWQRQQILSFNLIFLQSEAGGGEVWGQELLCLAFLHSNSWATQRQEGCDEFQWPFGHEQCGGEWKLADGQPAFVWSDLELQGEEFECVCCQSEYHEI